MAIYSFLCIGSTGDVAAVEVRECPNDAVAAFTAETLFEALPSVKNSPSCQRIDVFLGDRLVEHVRRPLKVV